MRVPAPLPRHGPAPLSTLLLPCLLLAACGGGGEGGGAAGGGRPPDVLLVTLDTTRADRIGCYGHAAARTPALDALAARGVRFERAFSQVPLTLPSHATLLTGVHPPGHGLRVNFQGALPAEVESLAERLDAAGYRTGAFVAAWVLNAEFGLDRGFEEYGDVRDRTTRADKQAERPADEVVDAALAWLARDDARPFLCWVHFYDAHDPYEPPPGATPPGGDAYDGEIAFADAQLARLLAALEARGRLAGTLVCVTADHGEMLGEHGETTHGLFVYEAATRVPLVIAGPGVERGRVEPAAVGLVDLHPTLLELAGLAPGPAVEGRSLAPALRGAELASEPVYSESEYGLRSFGWAPLRALANERWRYVLAPREELYDRAADPAEADDLAAEQPDVAARLRDALGARLAARARRDASAVALGADAQRQLSSLGYVAGRAGEIDVADLGALRDPKDAVHIVRDTMQAKRLSDAGRHAEVVELVAPLVAESPESDEVWALLARSLAALGRHAEAEEAFGNSLRAAPDQPERIVLYADSLLALGRPQDALAEYERALALDPDLGQAHSRVGTLQARAGRLDLALAHFQRYVELEPGSVNARCNLANALLASGRAREGVDELERALELDPACAPALRTLPEALRALGDRAGEVAALRRARAAAPDDPRLALRLAWLLATGPEPDPAAAQEALALAQRFVGDGAADVDALDVLAACRAAAGDPAGAAALAARALELAPPGPQRDALAARLELYRAGRAFRAGR